MRWLTPLLLVGCSSPSSDPVDVVGPFTAAVHRYTVDSLTLPLDSMEYGADLNGDGKPDNELGNIMGAIGASNNQAPIVNDLIAAGVLRSVVEISAADLSADSHVGVRFQGLEGDGGDFVGGAIEGGAFRSNSTPLTTHPASMTVRLPMFIDVDPQVLELIGVQIDLLPGGGGYDGRLSAALRQADIAPLASAGLLAMLAADPYDHPYFYQIFDQNHDGVLSADELLDNSIIANVLKPDVALFDDAGNWHPDAKNRNKNALSVGFAFHLTPCESGSCSTATPVDTCHDRALDGGETDVDCGGDGACIRCLDGRACNGDGDCRSRLCQSGRCSPTLCSDQKLDGDESDLDCGGSCVGCTEGWLCRLQSDCAAGLKCTDVGFSSPAYRCE